MKGNLAHVDYMITLFYFPPERTPMQSVTCGREIAIDRIGLQVDFHDADVKHALITQQLPKHLRSPWQQQRKFKGTAILAFPYLL